MVLITIQAIYDTLKKYLHASRVLYLDGKKNIFKFQFLHSS